MSSLDSHTLSAHAPDKGEDLPDQVGSTSYTVIDQVQSVFNTGTGELHADQFHSHADRR